MKNASSHTEIGQREEKAEGGRRERGSEVRERREEGRERTKRLGRWRKNHLKKVRCINTNYQEPLCLHTVESI